MVWNMIKECLGTYLRLVHWISWHVVEACILDILAHGLRHILDNFGTWFDAYLGDIGYMIWGIFLETLE
jgi:hypothetical protein